MNRLLFYTLALLSSGLAYGQYEPEVSNYFGKELTGQLQVYGKGIGFDLKIGKYHSNSALDFFHAEFITLRDPKEVKIVNSSSQQSAPYTFNKINQAFPLHLGYGYKRYLARKDYRNAVAVSANICGGLSLTFLKPIYVNMLEYSPDYPDGMVRTVKTSEESYPSQSLIIGNAGFGYGLDELSMVTGAYVKFGLSVDWSDYFDAIKALEIGVIVDAYTKPLPLLRNYDNRTIFTNFYLAFVLGKKY